MTAAIRSPSKILLQHPLAVLAIFSLCAFLLYGNSLSHAPIFDDTLFLVWHQHQLPWSFNFSPRVLETGTIVATSEILGSTLMWQRLENVLFHITTVMLIFSFSKTLLAWLTDRERSDRDVVIASFLASLLFLVHPVAAYSVAYLNQRSTEMATIASLLTLMVFWRGLQLNSQKYFIAMVPLYVVTLLCKEHAVMLPALCLCLAVLYDGGVRGKRLLQFLPYALACVVLMYIVVIVKNNREIIGQAPEHASNFLIENYVRLHPGFNPAKVLWYSIQTQGALFFKYWQLWLLPNPMAMSIDMRTGFATSQYSAYTAGLAAYIVFGLAATLMLTLGKTRTLRFMGFTLLSIWLLFWTEFVSLRLQEVFVLYRSYLWFVFLVPAVALGLLHLEERKRYMLWGLLFVLFTAFAVNRISTMKNEMTVWQDAAFLAKRVKEVRPGIERIYYNLGTAYLNYGHNEQAITALNTALNYVPTAYSRAYALNNLALAYQRSDHKQEAAQTFIRMTEMQPDNERAWRAAADSLDKAGSPANAKLAWNRACDLGDSYSCEHLGRAPAKL